MKERCSVDGGDGIFNVASLCGLLVSECSDGQRVSGAFSGFHGPGLVVAPLALQREFPEPCSLGSEDVVGVSVLLFFFPSHSTLEKNNRI